MLKNVRTGFYRCLQIINLMFTVSCAADEIYYQEVVVDNTEITIQLKVVDNKSVGKDIPKRRKIKLSKAGNTNTIKLWDSQEGETEIRIYFLDDARLNFDNKNESDLLVLEDGWMIGVIEYETLQLVEMNYGEEYLKSKISGFSEKECIGKFFRSKFIEGNCEIESD